MKKILYTATLLTSLVGALSLNSCRDAVEIVQPGVVTDEQLFTSVGNLDNYLKGGVYGQLEPSYAIYLTAVLTDEVKPGAGSGGQEFGLHRYFLDNSDTYTSNIWLQNYRVINRVNRLLQGAKSVTPANATEQASYNSIVAQARAIRAFAYLQLETYFSTNMKDESALGVILMDHVPTTDEKLPRSTNAKIYELINSDLDYARSVLPYGTDRFYVDKGFVNALSARFNLYRGNTALARQYAQDVVSNAGLTLTTAVPIQPAVTNPPAIGTTAWNTAFYATASSFNPYRNLWNDSARGEIIFSLNRLATGVGVSIGTYWNTNASNLSGVNMWYMGKNLFTQLNTTDGDIRRYAFIDPTSNLTKEQYVIDKYPGKTAAATRNDVKLFRLSEMYFILAEAAAENGDLGGAANYVQQVRTARNYKGTATTPVYASQAAAFADILKERRAELAFEGHRYIDLKRLASKAGVTMDRDLAKDDLIPTTNLPNDSYKYTLPIPLAEISANPEIQQNPGY